MPTTPVRALLALALFSAPAFADSISKSTAESAPAQIEISAGAYHANRSLTFGADNTDGLTQYRDIEHDGAALDLSAYPLRHTHANGWVSHGGVSFGIGRSVGADVSFDDAERFSIIDVTQTAATAALHHRLTAWRISVDSQLGVGHARYSFDGTPSSFEVPETAQTYASAGLHLGVNVFRGITLAGGAQVMAGIGGAGELSSADWFGEGQTFGTAYDASLTVPLPKGVFVRASVSQRTLTTDLDGNGAITEMEGVSTATDTTTSAGLQLGLRR